MMQPAAAAKAGRLHNTDSSRSLLGRAQQCIHTAGLTTHQRQRITLLKLPLPSSAMSWRREIKYRRRCAGAAIARRTYARRQQGHAVSLGDVVASVVVAHHLHAAARRGQAGRCKAGLLMRGPHQHARRQARSAGTRCARERANLYPFPSTSHGLSSSEVVACA